MVIPGIDKTVYRGQYNPLTKEYKSGFADYPTNKDVKRFVDCALKKTRDKDIYQLEMDYANLFGVNEGRSTYFGEAYDNQYRDFCRVFHDALLIGNAASSGELDKTPPGTSYFNAPREKLESTPASRYMPLSKDSYLLRSDDGHWTYITSLDSEESEYVEFLRDGCDQLRGLVDEWGNMDYRADCYKSFFIAHSEGHNVAELWEVLFNVHSVDLVICANGVQGRYIKANSYASALWLVADDAISEKNNATVKICQHCGNPFIATGKQRKNAIYCPGSCKQLAYKARLANPAQ